ncbi:hypothetical protein PCASD_22257, partial [Puccinia coronata f. sp. avenae]
NIQSKIILNSGSSSHVFNNSQYFDQLKLGEFDFIKTGKENANLPIRGMEPDVLHWGNRKIALEGCLYVPNIVVNLISPGILDGKNCSVRATGSKFSVLKGNIELFGVEPLKVTHKTFGHASIQRIEPLIDRRTSAAKRANFECKSCILSKMSKQPFKLESRPTSKVFERVHLNLIGPITPESKIKSNYILTVVDNYSGYLAGFPIAKKDDAANVLINLLENEKKRLGYL